MTPLDHSQVGKYLWSYFLHYSPDFLDHSRIPDSGNGVLLKDSCLWCSQRKLNLDWSPFKVGGSH